MVIYPPVNPSTGGRAERDGNDLCLGLLGQDVGSPARASEAGRRVCAVQVAVG